MGVMPFYIGLFVLLMFILFDSKTVRIQWNSVASFLAVMTLVTFLRLALMSFKIQSGTLEILNVVSSIPLWTFSLVFWEDAFFVLPLVFMRKFRSLSHPLIWGTCMITSSLFFAHVHLYQGMTWAALTAFYPYFFSYRYGMRYGFGTVMVCHILYDFITYFTIVMASWFV